MVNYDKEFAEFNNIISKHLEEKITLFYPERREECPNCYLDTFGTIDRSVSKYKENGPVPFENGMPCPYCDSKGYKAIEQTEDILGRLYKNNKEYNKKTGINIADGSITFICRIDYFSKIVSSKYMIPKDGLENLSNERYELTGHPEITSFVMNPVKYITSIWAKLK